MLRYLTAGESHGQALVVIVEGLPARLPITIEAIADELARRRLGYGRGPRMRFERDDVEFLSGVRHGRTLGSPVSILIRNTEWPKWVEEMSPAPGATAKPLRQPRPGHADLAGMQKYGFDDARDVLERASARETAARVAAGTCAKALLTHLGVSIVSHVVQLGPVVSKSDARPGPEDLERVDASPVRCFDEEAEQAMVAELEAAAKAGDSLGGVAEVLAYVYRRRDVTAPQPTLVFYHGGGWILGTKESALMSLMPWLEMGWNVVNVEYRMANVALAPATTSSSSTSLAFLAARSSRPSALARRPDTTCTCTTCRPTRCSARSAKRGSSSRTRRTIRGRRTRRRRRRATISCALMRIRTGSRRRSRTVRTTTGRFSSPKN